MTKLDRIEDYLINFFASQIMQQDFDIFYKNEYEQRHYRLLTLDNGNNLLTLMTFVNDVINDKFRSTHLIPNIFTTPDDLLFCLEWTKKYITKEFDLLSTESISLSPIFQEFCIYKNEILKAIDYALLMYDLEDNNLLLYQDLRYHLIKQDIESFINDLKSIFSSVSYNVKRDTEGFYHANVHLILKLLGFDITSEDETEIGRIDSVIQFSNVIYIFEFKFSKNEDDSQMAFQQIVTKGYATKYILERKPIWGIGVSFNEEIKNIRSFKSGKLTQN